MTAGHEPDQSASGRWQTALAWIRRASALLTADLPPTSLALRGLELATEAVACDHAVMELLSEDGGTLTPAAIYEAGQVRPAAAGSDPPGPRLVGDAGPLVEAALALGESRSETRPDVLDGPGGARLVVPLMGHDPAQIEGIMTLERTEPRPFSARDEAIASMLTAYLSGAVENSQLLEDVRRSEARLRHLIESSWDGIATFGLDAEFSTVSGRLWEATGLEEAELVRRGWRSVVHEEDHPEVLRALETARGGESTRCRFRYRPPGGKLSTAEAVVSPVTDDDDVTSVLAIIRDITDMLERERRLQDSEKLAAVGRTISGIAHDLCGPLTSVQGLAQVLRFEIEDEELSEDIEVLVRESDLASRIVGELLAFVRRREPEPEVIDVNELVRDVAGRTAGRASQRRVEIRLELADGLPPIAGDPVQLERVVRNLVRNAEDALAVVERSRHVTLRTELADDILNIHVSDNGPGVPVEVAEAIFDPLVTTKKEGEGTGFGLAIARDIVEAHGGTVGVVATPGGGATFTMALPVTDVSGLTKVRPALSDGPADETKSVLVIDDDAAIRRALKRLLERRGHTVAEAEDGEDALGLLVDQGRRFDRIFMDNLMPRMSGPELFDRLAGLPEVVESVVFITGDALNPETRDFIERAGRPHVPKPFELADIVRAVEAAGPEATGA